MRTPIHQRILTAMVAAILVVFVAATAVAATTRSPSPLDKTGSGSFTAQAVTVGPTADVPVVYVATGENFPDALGAGPAAAIRNAPILLVAKNSIPDATRTELQRLKPRKIAIVGGTAVISPVVEQQLQAYAAGDVYRLSGKDRYETAADVSRNNFPAAHPFIVYDTSGDTTIIQPQPSCTRYTGLEVTIDAPGPGTIIAEANVNLQFYHTNPQTDTVMLTLVTQPNSCPAGSDYGGARTYFQMEAGASGFYYPWLTLKSPIHVGGAGPVTFYVTGYSNQPTAFAKFYYAYLDAMFIPDPGT